jgi:VanZ like family
VSVPITARLLITLALVVAIVILSVVPGRAQPGDSAFVWFVAMVPTPLQKLMHVVAYATLAFLWMWTLDKTGSLPLRMAFAFAISVGMGAALEWYQLSVPGRFGSMTDALLNTAGAVVGLIVAWVSFND